MTKEYIGVKCVTAWPQAKDDKPGYAVKYPDGYVSWSPKEVFEKHYACLGETTEITPQMIDSFYDVVPQEFYKGGALAGLIACGKRGLREKTPSITFEGDVNVSTTPDGGVVIDSPGNVTFSGDVTLTARGADVSERPALPITDGKFCGKDCPCQTVTDGTRCHLYLTKRMPTVLAFGVVGGKLLRCEACKADRD